MSLNYATERGVTLARPKVFPSAKKYKAKIQSVSPSTNRDRLEHPAHGCFLGVSLENSNFRTEKFASMLEWVSRRFSACTILIGDSIHRLTLQSSRNDLSPNRALSEAMALGQLFVSENNAMAESYKGKTRFSFLSCATVQEWTCYEEYYQRLKSLYDQDRLFRESVYAFSTRYQNKSLLSDDMSAREQRVKSSVQYFLEEFAIFACMKQLGLSIMVYPGAFSTLSEIAQGLHAEAPAELKSLTVVSLCLKGR